MQTSLPNNLSIPTSLYTFFQTNNKVALAFSGGCDSSYLLYAAKHSGATLHAYYMNTAFQPAFELEDARRLAAEWEVPLTVIPFDVLSVPAVTENPANRCYHCKNAILGKIQATATADGFSTLIDGTNASDDSSDRPGMQALKEQGILSPLQLCGITKPQVRELSKSAGLFTWDKPAYACLATRIPTGTPLTAEALEKVEKSEDALFKLGFSDFRVRALNSNSAKLQLPASQLASAANAHQQITQALSPFFTHILLDLYPRP